MNIALFDFDGTITNADMFTRFIRFSAVKFRFLICGIFLLPLYFCYRLGWFPARKLRVIVSFIAFYQRDINHVNGLGAQFAQTVIPHYIRTQALERINWHKANGDIIVVVSASLDIYLKHWCSQLGIQLICSELDSRAGKLTGGYVAGDCSCENKALKVKALFNLAQFDKIYAYGDTDEDLPLLAIATEKYMNWQKVNKAD